MENSQKAIQMAFAVFFFMIAATTAIFLYTNLIDNAKEILLISDRARMSAENTLADDQDYTRIIHFDEVVMTILDFENNKSYLDKLVVQDSSGNKKLEIKSDDIETPLDKFNDTALFTTYEPTNVFISNYNSKNKTLTYRYYADA